MLFCKKCQKYKEKKEFITWQNVTRYICLECRKKRNQLIYNKTKEKFLEKNKIYRDKNKEILKEKRRKRTNAQPKRKGLDPQKLRLTRKKALKIYKEKFPEKLLAHQILRTAIRANKIKKPNLCELCKKNKKLEGHHEDYNKPLVVKWLCRQCHIKLHRSKNVKLGFSNN